MKRKPRKRRLTKKEILKRQRRRRIKFALTVFTACFIVAGCQLSIRFSSPDSGSMGPGSSEHFSGDLSEKQAEMLQYAVSWLGTPYRYGGSKRNGVDCSGFVLQVYKSIGMKLPRTAARQYNYTRRVASNSRRAGDLVFFRKSSRISHVGIYIGNNKIIHSSTSRGVVKESLDTPYLKKMFVGYGRVEA